MRIIRRKHIKGYTPISNEPIRKLTDLSAIGLLAYMVSHSDTFSVTKTSLYERFGRCQVSSAVRRLEESGHFMTLTYRDGRRIGYAHFVSDFVIDAETARAEVLTFIERANPNKLISLSGIHRDLLDTIQESVAPAPREVSKIDSSASGVENQHTKKTNLLKPKTLKQEVPVKTSSAGTSVVSVDKGEVRKQYVDQYGEETVANVERSIERDGNVVVRTVKQYAAILGYRLKAGIKKVKNGGILPAWVEQEKAKQAAYEERRRKSALEEAENLTDEDIHSMLLSLC